MNFSILIFVLCASVISTPDSNVALDEVTFTIEKTRVAIAEYLSESDSDYSEEGIASFVEDLRFDDRGNFTGGNYTSLLGDIESADAVGIELDKIFNGIQDFRTNGLCNWIGYPDQIAESTHPHTACVYSNGDYCLKLVCAQF